MENTKILDTDALRERTLSLLREWKRLVAPVDCLNNPQEKMAEIVELAQLVRSLSCTFAYVEALRRTLAGVQSQLGEVYRAHALLFGGGQTESDAFGHEIWPLRSLLGDDAIEELGLEWYNSSVAIPEYVGEEDIPF